MTAVAAVVAAAVCSFELHSPLLSLVRPYSLSLPILALSSVAAAALLGPAIHRCQPYLHYG